MKPTLLGVTVFCGLVFLLGCRITDELIFELDHLMVRLPQGSTVTALQPGHSYLIANTAAHQRGERRVGRVVMSRFRFTGSHDSAFRLHVGTAQKEGLELLEYKITPLQGSVTKYTVILRDTVLHETGEYQRLTTVVMYFSDSLVELLAPHPGTPTPTPYQQMILDSATIRSSK